MTDEAACNTGATVSRDCKSPNNKSGKVTKGGCVGGSEC
jgi:hypothetical protein